MIYTVSNVYIYIYLFVVVFVRCCFLRNSVCVCALFFFQDVFLDILWMVFYKSYFLHTQLTHPNENDALVRKG